MRNNNSGKMPIAVWALSAGAFVIGTTEFVVMGLLIDMATDLKISISQAGYIVTAYAFGVVIGAPIMTAVLIKAPKRASLIALMGLFSLGNLLCASATSLGFILAARVLTAFAHASYFGIGSVVAADIAPPARQARAISGMFLGATIANVIGVPGGAWIGHNFGWRAAFIAVAIVGILATLATWIFIPKQPRTGERLNFRKDMNTLLSPRVLTAFLVTALGFGGAFTALTYIAPLLTQVTGIENKSVPSILFLFGVGMIAGNAMGGRLADWNALRAVRITLALLAASLFSMSMFLPNFYLGAASVFVLGIAMFSTIPALQSRAIEVARSAPTLAASCNIAAFNLGNALGAWLGGWLIAGGVNIRFIPTAGALLTMMGLGMAFVWRNAKYSNTQSTTL